MKRFRPRVEELGVRINPATPRVWSATAAGSWAVAGNWTPEGVPTAEDTVTFPDGTAACTVPSGTTAAAKSVVVNGGGQVIHVAGTLAVASSVAVHGGEFWVDPAATLSAGGLLVDGGSAFIVDAGAGVFVSGTVPGTGDSIKVTGVGTDFNLLAASVVEAAGAVEVTGTGVTGDSGLLVKGNAVIDSAGLYLYDTKLEFQGSGRYTLTVAGGVYVNGLVGINFRADYATGAHDTLDADSVAIDNTLGNNGVCTYFTGTPRVRNFKLIDTPNAYTGNFVDFRNVGGAQSGTQVASGQLATDCDLTGGDLTVMTYVKP